MKHKDFTIYATLPKEKQNEVLRNLHKEIYTGSSDQSRAAKYCLADCIESIKASGKSAAEKEVMNREIADIMTM